jgi:hypothetical protein
VKHDLGKKIFEAVHLRYLSSHGWEQLREGSNHSWWCNPSQICRNSIPRHSEIKQVVISHKSARVLGSIALIAMVRLLLNATVRVRYLSGNDTPNKPLEWSGRHQRSASPPEAPCLPLKGSVRRIEFENGT